MTWKPCALTASRISESFVRSLSARAEPTWYRILFYISMMKRESSGITHSQVPSLIGKTELTYNHPSDARGCQSSQTEYGRYNTRSTCVAVCCESSTAVISAVPAATSARLEDVEKSDLGAAVVRTRAGNARLLTSGVIAVIIIELCR